MANLIKFLRGTQGNLDALIQNGKATEGAFYLTSDTNRLYIGKTISGEGENAVIKPVSVNQGVISVSTLKDLPGEENNASAIKVPGEFYYVTGTEADPLNILCVYNGKTWVQVNPKYDDTEIQAAIEEINEGISTINGAIKDLQDEKADLTGATFTGKVYGVTPDDTDTDKTALVTRDYVDEAVSGLTGGKYATVEQLNGAIEIVNGDISTVSNAAKATADLVGKLSDSDAGTDITTIVDYIDSVKGVADEAARVAGLAATKEALDDHVEAYGEFVETTTDALGTINGALDTFATKENATLTGTATLNSKAIATEEYADGVAATKANEAKEAILGDAANDYNTLGKIEDKIGQLAEADAGLQGQIDKIKGNVADLANVMAFVGTTTTQITDGADTTPIAIIGNASYTPDAGDVVIYGGEEFVWTGSSWAQIGSANATTAVLEALEERIDDIDGENGAIATINATLEALEEADSGINGRIDALVETVGDNKDAFDAHVEAYNTYVSTNDAAVKKVGDDLSKAVEDLNKEDDTLAEAIAAEKAAREQLAKDLEWGSFDPEN